MLTKAIEIVLRRHAEAWTDNNVLVRLVNRQYALMYPGRSVPKCGSILTLSYRVKRRSHVRAAGRRMGVKF